MESASYIITEAAVMQEATQQQAAVDNVDHSLDHESRFGEIVAILIVGSVLSTAAVGLRAFTRLKMLHTFGIDDAVMLGAQALTIASAVVIGLESRYGLGSHSWVPPPEDLIPYMKSFYCSIIFYNIATCLVKVSILFQYRRIFANDIMQKLTTFGLAFMITWTVVLSILLPLMCYPVAAFWDDSVDGKCIDYLTIWYVMAGFNLVADFAIFSMPIPVINSLQLPRRQKRMLLLVFGLGFFTCIISALRIRTLRIAADTKDPYWDNVDAATWSFLEITIGTLAACLPTLRPIFVAILPRIFNGSSLHMKSSGRPSRYAGPYVQASHADKTTGNMYRSANHEHATQPSSSTEGLNNNRSDDIELGGGPGGEQEYKVSVTAGASRGEDGKVARYKSRREQDRPALGQIRTTTVVTQEVTFERGNHHQA